MLMVMKTRNNLEHTGSLSTKSENTNISDRQYERKKSLSRKKTKAVLNAQTAGVPRLWCTRNNFE